jgi:hypothetical protein
MPTGGNHYELWYCILRPDVIIFCVDLVTYIFKIFVSLYGKMFYMKVILEARFGKKIKLLLKVTSQQNVL